MNYSLKNLSSVFTRQRLLAVLLVLNVVVSCLVICFSYGLYQNYNAIIDTGAQPRCMHLEIKAASGTTHYSEEYSSEYIEVTLSEITVGETVDMLSSLSDDTGDNIELINLYHGFYNDIYCLDNHGEIISDTGIYENFFHIAVRDHALVCAGIDSGCISDEDYASGKKVVAVGYELFDPLKGFSINQARAKILTDEKYVMIEGEQFELQRINGDLFGRMIVPLTALDRDAELWVQPSNVLLEIKFEKPLTMSQYNELSEAVNKYFGDRAELPKLNFKGAEELYYYRTVLLISVVIAILAAINMAVLYRYILEKRSRELAIFRICGCTGRRAVMMYLAECLAVSLPLFALSELLWHLLLMPRLAGLFEHFENAYSFKLYAAIFGIYAVSVTVVMYIMIRATVKKHSLAELKTEAHSAGFLIFKVLETVQLSAVLVLIISIWSAGMSRYDLYTPFADLLQGKGYVVNYQGEYMYTDDFRKSVKGSRVFNVCWLNFSPEGVDSDSEDEMYKTVAYDDEIIDRFAPKLSDGVWLNGTEHSYQNDKMIPAIAAPDSSYSVGDKIISPDNMTEWDENYEPTRIEDLCFIVVGKLEDNASVFSYPYHYGMMIDHRDLYGVYNGNYVDDDVFLIRERDIFDIYGFDAPITGIQLVDCTGLSDEEYMETGGILKRTAGSAVVSFEELNSGSMDYIFSEMQTVFPIALCIFILTVISSISISAIYTKRHLRTYAIFYICGARWRNCALRSLRSGLITCGASVLLTAAVLVIGKLTFMKETVISFGLIPLAVCAGVLIVYLALSMIMPLLIIGKTEPREILKEE